MAYYRRVGEVPPTRHTAFRDDAGNLRFEELMGEEGFSSDSSLLYHTGVPSAITDSQPWELPDLATTANHPLKPRHLRLHEVPAGGDPVTGRRLVLGNGDVRLCYVVTDAPSPLYRNAVGDECVFVEAGTGTVETVFGALDYRPGDYVLIPRATTHRWVPSDVDGEVSRLYVIEANGHIAPPKRYLSRFGQFLEHAPYCERDLHGPATPLLEQGSEVEVLVKHRGTGQHSQGGLVGSRLTYATHPFDVVGWDGCLYPYTFNVEDFCPITGKIHQPPPVHQVFEGSNFVVCNFLPRKVDYHEGSIPVPYYHSNVDSDEVMFYVGGDYEARKGSGINLGSISLHPGGFAHGPQPSAVEASIGVEFFDETAVMVDTFRPLELGEAALATEDPAYAWTWAGRGPGSDSPAMFSNS
ncbi:homogentisate 1,2-dioxygenase [Nocardioides terrisoli]|uniref:homogentisate 1,2-dioxygenase n=1 Tax=Nocardioides terrisoli TaxID=3388267 RepID=UPI00287B62F2|nr:homogentisate 1,2-dioxygenase domain-containing protein [Nocardioides marmorisolisilvae]